jgi:LPXTG-motif cell wall-anchored protein
MKKFNALTTLAWGSVAAGALLVASVGVATAAPTSNFSVTTLTTDNDYATEGATDDNGPTAITSTHVLWNSENGIEAYAIADLSGATVTDVDTGTGDYLFTNLKTATAHYLVGTEGTSGDGDIFTITAIGSIDDDGTSSTAANITLSEDIVVNAEDERESGGYVVEDYCNALGSGYGHVVIWDYCAGIMWNIDLPSGTVTKTEGVNTLAELQESPTDNYAEGTDHFNVYGVVEHVDGEYSMVLPQMDAREGGSSTAVSRFAITDPAGTVTEILAFDDTPDFWHFAVNVEAGLWCTHIESGSDSFDSDDAPSIDDEPTICADATFSVTDLLPSTGANSLVAVLAGLALIMAGAVVLVRRPRLA